jgi:urea transport system substrate-binding protein
LKNSLTLWLASFLFCVLFASASAAKTDQPIRIGAVLPLTGNVAVYGAQAKLGIEQAVKDINKGGGVLGRKIEVVFVDDRTQPESAAQTTRDLLSANKDLLAIIGPITSSNLDKIEPVAEELKVPLLYATNYEGSHQGEYFFCLSTVPNQEMASLLPYMGEQFGMNYFLLGADHAWPHNMFNAAEPVIKEFGGTIVGKEYTVDGTKDFSPLIKRIEESKANVILFALKGDGVSFIPQAKKQGLLDKVKVAYLGLSETDLPFFEGKSDDMYVVAPFIATDESKNSKAFVQKIRKSAGKDAVVSSYVMTHYSALYAIKAALEKAAKADRESLAKSLEGLTFDTPTGPATIDPATHHLELNLVLAKTKGPNLVVVRRLGVVKPILKRPENKG